jgi:hypothetical protein
MRGDGPKPNKRLLQQPKATSESQIRKLRIHLAFGSWCHHGSGPDLCHRAGSIRLAQRPFMVIFSPLMAGRFPCLLGVALVMILLGIGRSGHAGVDYRLFAGSSVGVSDNPQSLPRDADVRADGFVSAQGRFELTQTGRLTSQRASYGIMATAWARNTQGSSLIHTLSLSSDIQASPGARVTLNAGATLAQMSMLDTSAASDPQTIGPRPAGDQKFLGLNAGEALSLQFGGQWRLDQAINGQLYRPINGGQGSSGNANLSLDAGISHLWSQDRAALKGRVGAMMPIGSPPAGQTTTSSSRSEFAEVLVGWSHDLSPDLTSELGAGVFVLRSKPSPVPSASASLVWRRTGREIELRAARAPQSNVYLGAVYERSFVSLRVGLPVDRREALRILAAADVEHDSMAAVSGGPGGAANVFSGRFGLHWQPGDTFVYGLDYTYRDQRASATDTESSLFSTFRRQMVTLTIEMHYPSGLL